MRSASMKIGPPQFGEFEAHPKFRQSAIKLYWARVCAYEFSHRWESLVKRHYEAAVGGANNLPYPMHEHLLAPPIPFDFALIIGDCLRNTRSALDYLVSEMARAKNLPDNNTIFPFADSASSLKGSFNEPVPQIENRKGRRAGALYDLSRKYPNLEAVIIDKIKPYDAANGADAFGDMLRTIVTADNIDKHRLMPITVQHVEVKHMVTDFGFGLRDLVVQGTDIRFPPDTKLAKDSDFSVDILFEEPARLAGKPVVSTLVEGCNAVAQVIEIFRREFDMTE